MQNGQLMAAGGAPKYVKIAGVGSVENIRDTIFASLK